MADSPWLDQAWRGDDVHGNVIDVFVTEEQADAEEERRERFAGRLGFVWSATRREATER